MDCKAALALLLVFLSSVSQGHGEKESDSESEHRIGFLVFVPGNLEAGSTAQAFVEADTTDPFNVELNFIHGNEERHFSSRALITGGSGFISIEVPKVDYWYGRVNVTGEVETTKETFSASQDNIYIYQDKQQATFIETDKPIYKPGQEVRFRLVTINSQFKPDVSNVTKIQIQSPQELQLAQWRDVERPQGLVDLSFQLITEPTLGTYKIRAYIDADWIEQSFKVEEYVLPKFEITVSSVGFLMIDAEDYTFQVCAKYTHGQPVRGSIHGQVGRQRREYQYNYYPRPRFELGGEGLQDGEEEPRFEDAVDYDGVLDNDGCFETTVSVLGMNLASYQTRYWQNKMGVHAVVTETVTGNELTKTTSVTSLEVQPMNLALESPQVFKPSIPYQGRIKVTYPDDTPAAGRSVTINATIDGEVVHSELYTADNQGLVFFEIPFATKNESISLLAFAHYEKEKTATPPVDPSNENVTEPERDSYHVSDARGYYTLNPAYSLNGHFIQIVPIYQPLNSGESVDVRVYYTSEDSNVASDFKFQIVARGKLLDAGATLLTKSRKRRTVSDDGSVQTECQRQVEEVQEKGEEDAFMPDCDPNGMFLPNQCHPVTNQCWCVTTDEGLEVQGTRRNPDEPPPQCPVEIFGISPDIRIDLLNQCQPGFEFQDGVKKCIAIVPNQCPPGYEISGESCIAIEEIPDISPDIRIDLLNQCPPGFEFQDGVKKCIAIEQPAETECQRQARESEGGVPGSDGPDCSPEGKFLQRQCHASTGHCWCVDEETGDEVPDTRSGPTEERVDCAPVGETECQREVRVASGLLGARTPSCEEDGTYSPQQCHGSTGHCWCVEQDGTEIETTRTGPGEDTVDCSETECQRVARVATTSGLLGARTPSCEKDGTYSPQQCHGSTGHCWCVEQDGTEIETTRTGPGEDTVDCSETECQREVRVASGLLGARTPSCEEDGTYSPQQCHGSTGHCWCVEQDGTEIETTRTGPGEDTVDCSETECQRGVRVASGLLGARTPSCEEDGTYSPQQCHGSTGHCWCVEQDGTEIETTRTGPGEDTVDCSETECQREVRVASGLLGAPTPSCEEDGTYSPQQCHGSTGHCWCVEQDGTEIEATRTSPGEDTVDCSVPDPVFTIPTQEPVTHVDPQELHEATFSINILPNMSPEAQLLVYFSSPEGEVVADSIRIKVNEAFENEVDLDFASSEVKPGGETTVTVSAEPGSLCSVGIVDKSVYVLGGDNKMTPQKLFSGFHLGVRTTYQSSSRCWGYYGRKKRSVIIDRYPYRTTVRYEDSTRAFNDAGLITLTNLAIDIAPCFNDHFIPIAVARSDVMSAGLGLGGAVEENDDKQTLRSYFPETWLWSLTTVRYGEDGCRLSTVNPGQLPEHSKCAVAKYGGEESLEYDDVQGGSAEEKVKDIRSYFPETWLWTLTAVRYGGGGCRLSTAYYNQSVEDSVSERGREAEGKEAGEIRSYFPETWLWTLTTVSGSSVELPLDVPHSITDWIANGFCTNVEKGVGIASPVTLRAFQPFFLSLSLPYSIIREEKTPIKATVFNYLDLCLVVRVTLADSDEFTISGADDFIVAVPAGEATTVTFKVASSSIEEIPIQVSAESIEDEEFLCGNEAVSGPAGTHDAVLRQLKVRPEGEEETISRSDYFCLEEGDEAYTKTVTIVVPEQHVPDTPKGEITVTGDLVGNTLSNVEDLLRMPYGCGEQNLLSMVPNIVALEYLEATGESTPEIEAEAKKFISAGYQRELNYRRDDNSYSAFGNSNPAGSTFLTAFVVRTYAHAKKFVDIDEKDLSVTIDWLRSIQEKDGSFRTVGYLAHKAMKGGVNNNVTLAAYVVSAFLEAGYTPEDSTVAQAFSYLNTQLDGLQDNYAMAILAYAYALATMDQFDQVYEKLLENAINEEGTMHWESNREDKPSYTSYYEASAKAQNTEMTAYILRAILLKKGFPDVVTVGSSMARWLVAQRNPRGGFGSTQDTVIGMTALAEFARFGGSSTADVTMTMAFKDGEEIDFVISTENRFVIQKDSFDEFPAEVVITAEGTGCVLYSVSAEYYIKREKRMVDPFNLGILSGAKVEPPKTRRRRDHSGSSEESDEEEEDQSCDVVTVQISPSYNGEDGASNMAIINFRPVSGYVFVKESLESLKVNYPFLRRYEVNGDVATFYFDEITSEQDTFFSVDLKREFEVEDTKPALVTIMDYYENDLRVSQEFNFTCYGSGILHVPELRIPPDVTNPPTTWTTPVSPTGFASSTPTAEPDYDECEVVEVCGGPEWTCINYPGTYECVCSDGYELDESETSCVASCPICADSLPEGSDALVCLSDLIQTMKVRVDGTVRPLSDVITNKNIAERYYYDIVIGDHCSCDLLTAGSRLLVIASRDLVGASTGRWDEALTLTGTAMIIPLVNSNKKDVTNILLNC